MKILGNVRKKLTSFYNRVSGQFKKTQVDSSSINEKNIITRNKCCDFLINLFKKRENLVKKTIDKYGLIKVIFVLPLNYIKMILLDFLTTLKEYQVIGTIIVMIIAGLTFWFLIENRFSGIETEIIEKTKEFKIDNKNVFIGGEIDLTVINKTATISIIKEEPKIFLKYQFGFSDLFKCEYIEITKYVKRTDDNIFPLEIKERKGRKYLKYTLTNDFFQELSDNFSNPNILTISIYIQYINEVNKKIKTTNKVKLNKALYKYKTEFKLNFDRGKDIDKYLDENKKQKPNR